MWCVAVRASMVTRPLPAVEVIISPAPRISAITPVRRIASMVWSPTGPKGALRVPSLTALQMTSCDRRADRDREAIEQILSHGLDLKREWKNREMRGGLVYVPTQGGCMPAFEGAAGANVMLGP